MYFEQFYLGCLAHASYIFGDDGVAAVVDPQRDVEQYLRAAEEHGLKIAHIFETHLHADFVSGHKELAERTGATIYIGAAAGAKFPHVPVSDGFALKMGRGEVRVLETPGHTPESVSLLLFDPERRIEVETLALPRAAIAVGQHQFMVGLEGLDLAAIAGGGDFNLVR